MVKISDVASLAGVSPGAVSRVLSNDPTLRVSDETRRRVVEAAAELNYLPSHAAQSLRTSKSRALALIVPDVTSAVFAELLAGAELAAEERGVNLVLASADRLEQDPAWLRRVVGGGRVDGVILQLPDSSQVDEVLGMVGEPVPIVAINSVDRGAASSIVLDDRAAIGVAVRHLAELGHTAIGFIGGTGGSFTGVRRREGFTLAMEGLGLAAAVNLDLGYTGANGRAAAVELLRGTLPTALVVANLNAALGLLAEFHANGVSVPEQVSIVAVHDVWYADSIWPPITTVKLPLRELGAAAVVQLLDDRRDAAATHRTITDPAPELVVRASTAPPRN